MALLPLPALHWGFQLHSVQLHLHKIFEAVANVITSFPLYQVIIDSSFANTH